MLAHGSRVHDSWSMALACAREVRHSEDHLEAAQPMVSEKKREREEGPSSPVGTDVM